tara:strand:+ start:828 stop:1304 length:477 start_codon:yes stop_codon:yes gene_type:complete
MRYRKCILPGLAKYRKTDSPLKKDKPINKLLKGDFKGLKTDLKQWKKKRDSNYKLIEATVPDVPFLGPGGIRKGAKVGKSIIDAFNKSAGRRRKQIKIIEESLKKKGYKIMPSKTTHGTGKSPLKSLGARGEYTRSSQKQGLERSAKDARKIKRQRGY